MSVVEQKKALRKTVRAKLKVLDNETIQAQSQQVWDRLWTLPEYQAARSIGMFLSMPRSEINTDPALIHAMNLGKTIYVPEVGKNFEHADMDLVRVVVDDCSNNQHQVFHRDWPRNKWGIPEPPETMPRVPARPGDLDVVIVPGLAFDRSGDRLGQGKGYYDRFLARMCSKNAKAPYLVAVGLQAQVVDERIPVAEYDRRMDMVLLPGESIVVQKK